MDPVQTDVIETKVSLPAIVTAVLGTVGAAVYKLVLAYGLLHPSADQAAALVGVGAAVLYVVNVLVGYYAPHTPRPVTGDGGELAGGEGAFVEPAEPADEIVPSVRMGF